MMRLFRKYKKHGFTNARSIVNNLVILHNVFGNAATMALYSEVEERNKILLTTSLNLLGREGKEIDLEFKRFLEMSLITKEK